MAELLKKTITVTSVSSKDSRYVIKDHENNSYSFFEKKKDGAETKAFFTFKSMSIQKDSQASISYSINGEYNNIMFFAEAGEQAKEVPPFKDSSEMKKMDNDKSKLITRVALAKSYIEAGHRKVGELIPELNSWLNWIYEENFPGQEVKGAEINNKGEIVDPNDVPPEYGANDNIPY